VEVFAEVFSITKFGKKIKKTSGTTSSIDCEGFVGLLRRGVNQ
jgi:hypothetical protein